MAFVTLPATGALIYVIPITGGDLPASALTLDDGTPVDASHPLPVTAAVTSLPAVTFAAPQHVIVDSATLGTVTVSGAVTQSGTWTVQQGGAPWSTTVSGSVAVTNANLDASLSTRASEATLAETHVTLGSTRVGRVSLYDAAGTQIATLPVSLAAAPTTAVTAVGGGALATAAAQTTANTSLASIDGHIPALTLGAHGGLAVEGVASGVVIPITGSVAISGTLPAFAATPTVNAAQSGTWALGASSAVIGHVVVDSAAGVAVTSLPAIPTGSNTIGAVTAPGAAALALEAGHLATIDTSAARIPAQGQALAAASMPVVLPAAQDVVAYAPAKESGGNLATLAGIVSAGKALVTETSAAAILAKFTDGLSRLGIIGKDGSTLSSATNGVPVSPETSSLWDVKDRAARLLGALTGINGTGIATAANPVPVQQSDGTNVFTAAKAATQTDGTQIAQVGAASGSTGAWTTTRYGAAVGATAIAHSLSVKGSAGRVRRIHVSNKSGGTIYVGFTNSATAIGNSVVPDIDAGVGTASGSRTFDFGETGKYYAAGICLTFSNTQQLTASGTTLTNITAEVEWL